MSIVEAFVGGVDRREASAGVAQRRAKRTRSSRRKWTSRVGYNGRNSNDSGDGAGMLDSEVADTLRSLLYIVPA